MPHRLLHAAATIQKRAEGRHTCANSRRRQAQGVASRLTGARSDSAGAAFHSRALLRLGSVPLLPLFIFPLCAPGVRGCVWSRQRRRRSLLARRRTDRGGVGHRGHSRTRPPAEQPRDGAGRQCRAHQRAQKREGTGYEQNKRARVTGRRRWTTCRAVLLVGESSAPLRRMALTAGRLSM